MAIIYEASLNPTKEQLLERIVGQAVTVLGTYRFDDPDGEVGVEAFIVRSGARTEHIVLTYRGAPLEGAEADLVSTMEHSILGRRWVYNGTGDPVAVACFRRALRGEQDQAVEEVWDNGKRIGPHVPTVRLSLVSGEQLGADGAPVIATEIGSSPEHTLGPHLRAEWNGGDAIVASIG